MITATDLEVRAGARTLLFADGPALRIQPGDRIGLVGRNGAGKTTTLRILAGEGEPYAGTVARTGEIGYLPQDPKEGDLDMLARDRVLSARGLDTPVIVRSAATANSRSVSPRSAAMAPKAKRAVSARVWGCPTAY